MTGMRVMQWDVQPQRRGVEFKGVESKELKGALMSKGRAEWGVGSG